MRRKTRPTVKYDARLIAADMAKRGWNDLRLAEAADVNQATIARFLKGTCRTAKTAHKIATALGTTVERYLVLPKAMAS